MFSLRNRFIKRLTDSLFLTLLISIIALTAGCSSDDGETITVQAARPPDTYTIGGATWGLYGTVVLQNNGADDLTVAYDWFYDFTTYNPDDTPYLVTVKTHPFSQSCYVTDGSGTFAGADVNIAVYCYDSGTLDTTFDSDGIAVHDGAAGGVGNDRGYAMTLDSSGRIVVAGYSYSGLDYDMALWRYNADGTLDTTFAGAGFTLHNDAAGGNDWDYGRAVAIDSSGRILVTGDSDRGTNGDMAIWRYNTDGTLDTTFAGAGFVTHHNAAGGAGGDQGNSIAIDSLGRIVVAGYSWRGVVGYYDMAIWRYNTDGTLDTTFNGNGIAVHNDAAGGNGNDYGNAISFDSSDKIVVAGNSHSFSQVMALWRYNTDGTLDTTFNSLGYATYDGGYGYALAFDPLDRIVVAGGNGDMKLWRCFSDGTLDTGFDTDGLVTDHGAAGGNGTDCGYGVAFDSLDRIFVAGYSLNVSGNNDMVIWRYYH